MDNSSASSSGQPAVAISVELLELVEQQCVEWKKIREWYAQFDGSLRQIDRTASVKAYDIIVSGSTIATRLARELRFNLPDVSKIDWRLSPRVDRPSGPI